MEGKKQRISLTYNPCWLKGPAFYHHQTIKKKKKATRFCAGRPWSSPWWRPLSIGSLSDHDHYQSIRFGVGATHWQLSARQGKGSPKSSCSSRGKRMRLPAAERHAATETKRLLNHVEHTGWPLHRVIEYQECSLLRNEWLRSSSTQLFFFHTHDGKTSRSNGWRRV